MLSWKYIIDYDGLTCNLKEKYMLSNKLKSLYILLMSHSLVFFFLLFSVHCYLWRKETRKQKLKENINFS